MQRHKSAYFKTKTPVRSGQQQQQHETKAFDRAMGQIVECGGKKGPSPRKGVFDVYKLHRFDGTLGVLKTPSTPPVEDRPYTQLLKQSSKLTTTKLLSSSTARKGSLV